MQRTLIACSITTLTLRGGWASREAYRNPWCSPSPMLSATSTNMWTASATSHISMSANITSSSHLAIGSSLIQTLHQIIDVTGDHWCLGGSPWPLGAHRSSGLHFLICDGICNSLATFLHGVYGHFHLLCSPGPTYWTPKAELNNLYISMEKTLLVQAPSIEQDCLSPCKDHSFGDLISGAGFLQYISYQWFSPHVGRWSWLPHPSQRVILMWMQ